VVAAGTREPTGCGSTGTGESSTGRGSAGTGESSWAWLLGLVRVPLGVVLLGLVRVPLGVVVLPGLVRAPLRGRTAGTGGTVWSHCRLVRRRPVRPVQWVVLPGLVSSPLCGRTRDW